MIRTPLVAVYLVLSAAFAGLPRAQCAAVCQAVPGIAPTGRVLALLALPGDRVAVGGDFQIPSAGAHNIAVLDRTTGAWHDLASGCNGPVRVLAAMPNGDLIAGGQFSLAGGAPAGGIARWDGTSWTSLGSGPYPFAVAPPITALLVLPNGDLLAAADLSSLGSPAVSAVMRWDGASWTSLGNPGVPVVRALARTPGGSVYAGGVGVRLWNGSTWTSVSPPVSVHTLLATPGGELFAGGGFLFQGAGGVLCENVARWDGTAWHRLSGGITGNYVATLAVLPGGDLLAGGSFWDALNIVGSTLVGAGAPNLARWNGGSWSSFATVNGPLAAIARNGDDSFNFGGLFTSFGNVPSQALASASSGCPATALPFGAGCASSVGPLALTVRALPWLGTTCATRATGVPAGGFGIVVHGFGVQVRPLASVVSPAAANCFLFTTADALELRLPVANEISAALPIPNLPALLGETLRQQVVAIEVGGGGTLVAATSSNSLVLTLGAY